MNWPPTPTPSYIPPSGEEFWNKAEETRDPAEREELVLEKIRAQVRYAYENSEFYREFYADVECDPRNITTFEEFRELPLLTSDDIQREQQEHPPFGRVLCIDEEDIRRIHGTSGTTSQPKVFGIGHDDWERIRERHAQILWAAGLRPDDRVIITSPFIQYIGSWGALAGVDRLGCTTFPLGAGMEGQTDQAVEWIADLQPDALYGTPSYALYLADTAEEHGYDPATDYSFRLMFFSGEPGASVPGTRKRIETAFDCEVIDQGSMAEVTPWMSNAGTWNVENGMLLWQDAVYAEVLDPESRTLKDYGEEGVPTYTHLERTSQPMIRYWSGDLTRWVSPDDQTEDPRTYPLLPRGIYGRTDDMLVVRGKNVLPSKVADCLHALDGFGDEFRIVVEREESLDTLSLIVEALADVDDVAFEGEVTETIKAEIGVTPEVTVVAAGELERTQFKADRIVDKRELDVEAVQ